MSDPRAVDPTARDIAEKLAPAYRTMLDAIAQVEPRIAEATRAELTDQRHSLKLIASENYASLPVLATMGTCSLISTPKVLPATASTPVAKTLTPSRRSPPSMPALCSALSTLTYSPTPALTPTSPPTGRSWPTISRPQPCQNLAPALSMTSLKLTGTPCVIVSMTSGRSA